MPTAAEVLNYLQNEGMLAMAHLEGPDMGLKLCPKGQQQGLQSEKPRISEFAGNYGLVVSTAGAPICDTPNSKEHSSKCLSSLSLHPISRHSMTEGHRITHLKKVMVICESIRTSK